VADGSYEALHARHYDVVYARKPYETEARFVEALVDRPGGTLLDVACGTGRHAGAFVALGHTVTGIDFNERLIEHARAAVPAGRFHVADMRDLALGERFDVVTCLFDAIGYPLDNAGVVAALRSIARHLAPGGRAAVEFLHAPVLIRRASPLGVRRLELSDGGTLVRIAQTTLDVPGQRMRVAYELIELRPDGTYERSDEVQHNRFFAVEEMRALMELAGLRAEAMVAAYADDPAVSDDTFHVMALASALDR
jgi:SAM-dependent methyltransferase